MMDRHIYLSFLGKGQFDKEKNIFRYDKTTYVLKDMLSDETEFVQVAELKHHQRQGDFFDIIIIATTETSKNFHFNTLKSQLPVEMQACVRNLEVSEELEPEKQWQWFERLLPYFETGDQLTVDLTHGFRAIPIVFSAAIHFLKRAKQIKLNSVYYGAYDKNRKNAPIIDLAEFYFINEWSEAVSRLVDDADARYLANLAKTNPAYQVEGLNIETLVSALQQLTDSVRNIDIHSIQYHAAKALELVAQSKKIATATSHLLLEIVEDKFSTLLLPEKKLLKEYGNDYLDLQMVIINLLLEHNLYMQAFTVMREAVGSLGLLHLNYRLFDTKRGRNLRYRAEVFLQMLLRKEETWRFSSDDQEIVALLMPRYIQFKGDGIIDELQGFLGSLIQLRNGFDHAWTSMKNNESSRANEEAFRLRDQLQNVFIRIQALPYLNNCQNNIETSEDPFKNQLQMLFLNLSNHPLDTWSEEQKATALALGFSNLTELPEGMPLISAMATEDEIYHIAESLADNVTELGVGGAFVAGDFSFTVSLVGALQRRKIKCYAATSERQVETVNLNSGETERHSKFRFIRWREYRF